MPDTLPLSDRRSFLGYFVGLGLGSTLFPGILWARVASGTEVNDAAIVAAAEIAGLTFSDDERKQMLSGLKGQPQTLAALRAVPLDNGVAPAIVFNPLPLMTEPPKGTSKSPVRSKAAVRTVPSNLEELCYEPVTVLSELVRTKKVTSTALTRMYLARLRRLDEKLKCVVTFTEERALRQAAEADAEIARGKYRGALHGIPWGAKDLFAVKGYPTTWGSVPYKDQQFNEDAAIVQRLVRRPRLGHRRRLRGIRHRHRNARFDFVAVIHERRHRPAPDVRTRPPHGRDGARLVDGQDRTDDALGRGCRARLWRAPRSRRPRPLVPRRAVQLGRERTVVEDSRRLCEERVRLRRAPPAQGIRRRRARGASQTRRAAHPGGTARRPVQRDADHPRRRSRRGVRRSHTLGPREGDGAAGTGRLAEHVP